MPHNPLDRVVDAFRRSPAPFTLLLLCLMVGSFTISLVDVAGAFLARNFTFFAPSSLWQPWRLFTYPVMALFPDILGLLFNGLALWWFGGSLERSWSTRGYASFWLAASAVTALSLSLGAAILGLPGLGVAPYLPLAAVILAWALLNPEQVILIYGLIPVKAKFIALAEVLIIFFIHASAHPLLGFFALGGCAFALWWTRFFAGRSAFGGASYPSSPRFDNFFNSGSSTSGASKRPKKILTPLDDRRTWKDWGPLAAYQRYKRRKQFERLLQDDD